MKDLVCVVADKNIEAAVAGVLGRHQALDVHAIGHDILVHPRRDPGCFHESAELLSGYRRLAQQALVVLDASWEGAPAARGEDLELLLEEDLRKHGLGEWARAVVIEPEVETWLFSDSPHVATALGWIDMGESLRSALAAQGFWRPDEPKPFNPKGAVEWALRRAKRPRSSAFYRELATKVSLNRCQDRSFLRMSGLLREWFGSGIT